MSNDEEVKEEHGSTEDSSGDGDAGATSEDSEPKESISEVLSEERTESRKEKLRRILHAHKPEFVIAGLVVLLLLGSLLLPGEGGRERDPLWLTYGGSYRLVPETISQSAAIPILVPDEAGTTSPEQVRITPEVRGEFMVSGDTDVLLFKPLEPLTVGAYYNVALTYGSTTIGADVRVAEDPSIVSILPNEEEETHEDSSIAISFSRPMIPLSTRDVMGQEEVPVTLDPPTSGTWKWKSTRLLEFDPEEDLDRSTRYTVTVHEGFQSLDGVPVPSFTHTFTTRTLKHDQPQSQVRFNEPLRIRYNQPVDIERTAESLVLMRDGKQVEPIVEYAAKRERGFSLFGLTIVAGAEEVDQSTLLVRPLEDKHGRRGLWDFESRYALRIEKHVPTEGNLGSESALSWSYAQPSVVSRVAVESERSSHVELRFFDPEGTVVITFAEDVDIARTQVELPGLQSVVYGTECKTDEDGRTVESKDGDGCEEVDNKRELRVRVRPELFAPDTAHTLTVRRVVSADGYVLMESPREYPLRTVPPLRVLRTNPSTGDGAASLTGLTFCTNTPLARPESVRDWLRVTGYVVYPDGPWSNSRKVLRKNDREVCNEGEYQTTVRYGLHPETAYTLEATLTDEFGASAPVSLSVTTGKPESEYTRIHRMQKEYNVTVPGKTQLLFATENLTDVQVRICKVDAHEFLQLVEAGSLSSTESGYSSCTLTRDIPLDLPDRFWVYNYFHFDIADYIDDPRGHYVLTLSHPQYTHEGKRRFVHSLLSVSNLTVGEKRVEWYQYSRDNTESERVAEFNAEHLYWVLHASSLNPIGGARVTSYHDSVRYDYDDTLLLGGTGVTGSDGVARIPAKAYTRGAVVEFGNDTAVVVRRTDTLMNNWGRGPDTATYLYTDRPLYRPGDTVYIKGIDRIGYDNEWETLTDYEAEVTITNSRGDTLSKQSVAVSDHGTFALQVELPADAPLGHYSIGAFEGYGSFSVEEYEGAPFKVELKNDEEEYLAGQTMETTIDAQYYFDMPVAEGSVEYTVLSQDYYFDRYEGEYFDFGRGWYSCYWCSYGDEFITRGKAALDSTGKATIRVPLDFDTHYDDADEEGSKIYTVIARVSDVSGKQVVGQGSAIVHRGPYYLGVKSERYLAKPNEPALFRIKSVDTEGAPTAVSGIEVTATRIEWESYRRKEVDGGYYWHSEEKRTQVATRRVATNGSGDAQVDFTFEKPGRYEVEVRWRGQSGAVLSASTGVYVSGWGGWSVRPTNNESLDVRTDKPSYESGEQATVLVESPFVRTRALITLERGDIYEYWTQVSEDALVTQTVPLSSSYTPEVYATALLVGPGPQVKYGSVRVPVDADEHELTIDVTPSKESYLPGEEVILSVRTTDSAGLPQSAEVSVAVVDMSVLALKGNPKKSPADFFYGNVGFSVSTGHSAKNLLEEMEIPVGTKGGGGGQDDLETRKRGIFKDTAHWQAQVQTDENGVATVRFTLPDNLTTWQIESLGVTKDTKVGVDYKEFVAKKRLMTTPIRPRFVVPGDTMLLGVQVGNNTSARTTVRAHIESDTLEIVDTEARTVWIEPGGQKLVYFTTRAPRGVLGDHTVTFYAESDDLRDVVEQRIPVLEDKTYEVTATAGLTVEGVVSESVFVPDYALPGEGGLTVRAQPTLVASLLDAVRGMAGYPYGCSEQIASRLASLATIERTRVLFGEEAAALARSIVFTEAEYSVDEAIQKGLADLLSRQDGSGGFPFYTGGQANLFVTVEVVSALTVLRETGYVVSDRVFENAARFITEELARNRYYGSSDDFVARAAFALSSPYIDEAARKVLVERVTQLSEDRLKLERLPGTALGYLAIATLEKPYSRGTADSFYAALENRLEIDARGAYVETKKTGGYSWFETPEKNTALLLHAIAKRGGEHQALDTMLRWLLTSKRSDEAGWGSTNATFTVLDAALRLAEVREENEAAYLLTLTKDGEPVTEKRFTPETLFSPLTYTFPLSTFARETLQRVALLKTEDEGRGTVYYDAELRYALPPDLAPPRDEGITVERTLKKLHSDEPVSAVEVGDLVEGTITITLPKEGRAVAIESYIPAGFAVVNEAFATESSRDLTFNDDGEKEEQHRWNDPEPGPRRWPVSYQELHDDRVFVFAERVAPGVYEYTYVLRALVPGEYRHMPATVSEMYTPEVFGRTAGETFVIEE